MPRIPVFTARRDVPVARLPRASDEAFGSEIGASLKDLGEGIGDVSDVLADALKRREEATGQSEVDGQQAQRDQFLEQQSRLEALHERRDAQTAALALDAKTRNRATATLQDLRAQPSGDGDEDLQRATTTVGAVIKEELENAPAHLAERLRADMAGLAVQLFAGDGRAEAQRQAGAIRDRLAEAIELNAETLSRDPTQFDAIIARTGDAVENLGLSPPQTRAIMDFAANRLAEAVVLGRPPRQGLSLLTSGELDDDFAPGVEDRLFVEVQANLEREEQEARIEASVGRSRAVFGLLKNINRDEATHADIERLDAEIGLSAGERDRLHAEADRRLEEQRHEIADISLVDEALAGRAPLDPSNPFHRLAIDRHFLRTAQAWSDLSQDELSARIATYISRVGAIPEPVLEAIQTYAQSGTPDQQAAVVDLARRILSAAPALLDDFAEDEIDALRRADEFVSGREVPQQQDQGLPQPILTAAPALPLLIIPAVPRLAPLLAPFLPLFLPGDSAQQSGGDKDGEDEDGAPDRPDTSGTGLLPGQEPPRPPQPDFFGIPPNQRRHLEGRKPPKPPRTPEENARRGREAIRFVMSTKESVPFAMYREDVGWIVFDYGKPGRENREFRGGFGLSHIHAKHGEEALRMLPEIIARGDFEKILSSHDKRRVRLEFRGFTAFVSLYRDKKRETFVITAFDFD